MQNHRLVLREFSLPLVCITTYFYINENKIQQQKFHGSLKHMQPSVKYENEKVKFSMAVSFT